MTGRAEMLTQLESEVGVMLRRVRRVIGARAASVHPDIAPSSYLLLVYVADKGPVRASSVADIFEIDKGAISRQVQHLIELGLLERTPDPEDGRAHLLGLTDEARVRLHVVHGKRREWLEQQLGDWTLEDLDGLVGSLARYNRALEWKAE